MAAKKSKQVMEVITISDITTQILTNAHVLLANEKSPLKVVTSQVSSGLIHHTVVLAEDPPDPRWPKGRRTHRVVLEGPGGPSRRASMMGLLEETEKKISKQVLKK